MPADMELQVVASLLRRGRSLDQLSTGLTCVGVLFGLAQLLMASIAPIYLLLSLWMIILGLLQKYWALRVAFDADLFALLARDIEPALGSHFPAVLRHEADFRGLHAERDLENLRRKLGAGGSTAISGTFRVDAGSSNSKVVPPGPERAMRRSPPHWCTKPLTIASPRPGPVPLVLK